MQYLNERLPALRAEFDAGQARLRELEVETAKLRDRMLLLSGAIQALEEMSAALQPQTGTSPGATDRVATQG